ncbi:MAG: hypothetical protein RL323_890 [Pseudomonadota bacterium]
MNELQVGLLGLGVVLIGGVWAYNQWAARRSAPMRSDLRPVAADEPEAVSPGHAALFERNEPVLHFSSSETSPESLLGTSAFPARGQVLDALIDAIAPVSLEQVVSGDAVLAAMPRSRRVGSKPLSVEGLHTVTLSWEVPRAGERYRELQIGVQLANRAGALNEIEFSEFVMKAQAFADALSATPDFPDMMEEVARARELDQFASAHDALLGFTVRASRAAWSPGYLAQHAAQLGLVAGALPGRMVLPSSEPGSAPVLVLQYETQAALAEDPEQSALREFNLVLDVAQVARSERPFVNLRQVALALAEKMEGVVTDDMGNPLSRDAMDAIGADLEVLYDALEARDFAAGSVLARRLFS